jgi:hypothetical protein
MKELERMKQAKRANVPKEGEQAKKARGPENVIAKKAI